MDNRSLLIFDFILNKNERIRKNGKERSEESKDREEKKETEEIE